MYRALPAYSLGGYLLWECKIWKQKAVSGPTQLCTGTHEPGVLCAAGLSKHLLSDGAWTSFLINKLQALQKYLGVYTVLGFPMDTGKGAGGALRRWMRQEKVWAPHPVRFWVPRHSWPPRLGPPATHTSSASSAARLPSLGSAPIPCSLTLSFTYSIISTDVLWFLKLPLSQ